MTQPSERNHPRNDSLDTWSGGLREVGISDDVISEMRMTHAARYERLRSMELLTTPVVTIGVDRLLVDPTPLDAVPGVKLFCFLEPKEPGLPVPKLGGRKLAREDVVGKVLEALGEADLSKYTLTVLKAHEILFNGNIIVRRDGEMFGEFASGPRSPSRQATPIACRIVRDEYLSIFRYTVDDEETRRTLYKAIAAIPGYGEGRDRVYVPGYYEVALGQDPETGRVLPLFYDYRDHPFFIR